MKKKTVNSICALDALTKSLQHKLTYNDVHQKLRKKIQINHIGMNDYSM